MQNLSARNQYFSMSLLYIMRVDAKRIVTAANSDYFHSLLTLLTTNYHRNDPTLKIDIWDLGLTEKQRNFLKTPLKQHITLRAVGELGEPPYQDAFSVSPRSFTWKPWIIRKSISESESLLWLDAGVAIVKNLEPIFSRINKSGYLLLRNNRYLNRDFTSSECVRILEANHDELIAPQIHGNILGFSNSIESKNLINDWCDYMSNSRVAISDELNHRHDQSVISILAARTKKEITDARNLLLESEDYQKAIKNDLYFLAHRRRFYWIDYNSIIDL